MRRAQKQFAYFCKSYQFLTGCRPETRRLILGCPTAKWVVSSARNALIACPGLTLGFMPQGLMPQELSVMTQYILRNGCKMVPQ